MNDNEWFGKEITILGDVQYIGEDEDPNDNRYMQAYAKALKEVYGEKEEIIETENPS
jgi:uncharacterized protein affecting Mg2+/Co2+ transport